MTERGVPSVEGSPACPFVAFEDDRDERADRPDHRHRCYAEAVPAPRALAHQEAYCLSSAFPVCPTFQDWARRESARARAGGTPAADPGGAVAVRADDQAGPTTSQGDHDDAPGAAGTTAGAGAGAAAAGAAATGAATPNGDDDWRPGPGSSAYPADGPAPRRNPPRDWAAPPPWASGSSGASFEDSVSAPDFIEKRSGEGVGLAGSPADRIASGNTGTPTSSVGADPDLAGLVGGAAAVAAAGSQNGGGLATNGTTAAGAAAAASVAGAAADEPMAPPAKPGKRPAVSSTRAIDPARDRERERERAAAAERAHHEGPSWERSRRFEAYPTIKTRSGMPNLPRVGVLFVALLIGAGALFFLPQFLSVGGGRGGAAPTASVRPSASVEPSPTPEPVPTPQTYTIKQGDTLSKVAKRFGVSIDELLAANKDTIKDADKIAIGDEIIIPVAGSDEVSGASASPKASAAP